MPSIPMPKHLPRARQRVSTLHFSLYSEKKTTAYLGKANRQNIGKLQTTFSLPATLSTLRCGRLPAHIGHKCVGNSGVLPSLPYVGSQKTAFATFCLAIHRIRQDLFSHHSSNRASLCFISAPSHALDTSNHELTAPTCAPWRFTRHPNSFSCCQSMLFRSCRAKWRWGDTKVAPTPRNFHESGTVFSAHELRQDIKTPQPRAECCNSKCLHVSPVEHRTFGRSSASTGPWRYNPCKIIGPQVHTLGPMTRQHCKRLDTSQAANSPSAGNGRN